MIVLRAVLLFRAKWETLTSILLMGVIVLTRLGGTLLAFVVLARFLSLSDFGSFVSGYSLAMIVAVAVDYGFSHSLLRDVGADRGNASNYISGGLRAKFVLSALAIATAPVLASWFYPGTNAVVFYILICFAMFNSFAEFFGTALRALGRYHEEAITQSLCTLGMFAGMFIGGYNGLTAAGFAVVLAASKLVQLAVLFMILVNNVRVEKVLSNWGDSFAELRRCMPYAADQGTGKLLDNVDILIVSHALGPAAAGIYQAGQKLMLGLSAFAMVLSNVFLPRLASASNGDATQFRSLALKMAALMTMTGLAGSLIFVVNPRTLVDFIFGEGFSALAPLMPHFAILLVLRYLAGVFGILLTALGMQSVRLLANLVSLALVLITAFWLIQQFGIGGMIYSQIAAVIVLTVIYTVAILTARAHFT